MVPLNHAGKRYCKNTVIMGVSFRAFSAHSDVYPSDRKVCTKRSQGVQIKTDGLMIAAGVPRRVLPREAHLPCSVKSFQNLICLYGRNLKDHCGRLREKSCCDITVCQRFIALSF
jgi:hypothetical protein